LLQNLLVSTATNGAAFPPTNFLVAALGRDCDDFTLHIYASLAEAERRMISERIKAALARSDKPLGLRNPTKRTKAFLRRLRARSTAGVRRAALERAEAYRVHIEWALAQRDRWGSPVSFSGAAGKLNGEQLRSPMGGRWSWRTVRDIAFRLGFSDRVGFVRGHELQARVNVVFKQHPGWTAQQLIEKCGFEYSVGIVRASAAARRARESLARNHWTSRRLNWPVDRYTVTRTRISEIWKRHPQWSAREVIERLKPGNPVRRQWVQKMLADCFRASARLTTKERRIGRRFFHPGSVRLRRAAIR
jgi:AraC-like DNA-binding protein